MDTTLSDQELKELQAAKALLENPNLAIKIASLLGTPIEKLMDWMPRQLESVVSEVTRTALTKSAEGAIFTIRDTPGEGASNWWHKFAVAASGAGGGFFGMAGLPVELPISTTIMLRSIADIARSEGFNVGDLATQNECIAVLGLGGKSAADDAADAGYLAARAGLAKAISEGGSKLITSVAARFSIQVGEKVAGQAVPIVGAACGAIINTLFIDHFQDMARGHFTVLRLSKKHGEEAINRIYATLPASA
jgi:EcsC protein family